MVQIKGIYLENSESEAITDPAPTPTEGEDLVDRHPGRIKKSIKNCRYAYNTDPTVRGIILNNATTANNQFRIECEDAKARKHIRKKVKEWNLDNLMTQCLLRAQRDGFCFVEKGIFENTIKTRFLAYDGVNYEMKIIRNPQTDEIIGYKQRSPKSKDPTGWEKKEFNEVNEDNETKTDNYTADKVIYFVLIEESGKGESFIAPILDTVDSKKTLERFMLSAAHKAGNLIGITVGDETTSIKDVPKSFITKLLNVFSRPVEKDVAIVPRGVDVSTIGNSTLPELQIYLKYYRNEIFIALQTPESLFSTESSNRSTAEVQADDDTGYKVFITFLRDALKKYFEQQLIDHELALQKMNSSIGKCYIIFDKEEEDLTPLKPGDDLPETNQIDLNTGENIEGETSATA